MAAGLRARPETFDLTVDLVRIMFPVVDLLVMSAWCSGGAQQPPPVLPLLRRAGPAQRREVSAYRQVFLASFLASGAAGLVKDSGLGRSPDDVGA